MSSRRQRIVASGKHILLSFVCFRLISHRSFHRNNNTIIILRLKLCLFAISSSLCVCVHFAGLLEMANLRLLLLAVSLTSSRVHFTYPLDCLSLESTKLLALWFAFASNLCAQLEALFKWHIIALKGPVEGSPSSNQVR